MFKGSAALASLALPLCNLFTAGREAGEQFPDDVVFKVQVGFAPFDSGRREIQIFCSENDAVCTQQW